MDTCTHMDARMHTHTHAHTHTCTHTRMHTHTHLLTHTTDICTHIHMHMNRPILVPSGECPGLIQSLGKCWQPAPSTAQSSSGRNKVWRFERLYLL